MSPSPSKKENVLEQTHEYEDLIKIKIIIK